MYQGLLLAVLTGLSWVLTGAIIGAAERRGCGAARQQLVMNGQVPAAAFRLDEFRTALETLELDA